MRTNRTFLSDLRRRLRRITDSLAADPASTATPRLRDYPLARRDGP